MYGKILRIDLTERKSTIETTPTDWQTKYFGRKGVNDRLLWEHFLNVSPHIDPLGPDNVLICGVGPLGATGILEATAGELEDLPNDPGVFSIGSPHP